MAEMKSQEIKQENESSAGHLQHTHHDLWKKRLSCLTPEEQAHIAKKYYGGHYPWKG